MGKEHSIDDAFDEIKKILGLVKQGKYEKLSGEKIEQMDKMLSELEKKVDDFVEDTEDELRDAGVPESQIRRVKEEVPSELSKEDKETLNMAMKLKNEVIQLRDEVHEERGDVKEGVEEEPKKSPQKKKKRKKMTKKSHKKKFRRLGGEDKWKPL